MADLFHVKQMPSAGVQVGCTGNRQTGPLGWREHPSPLRRLALAQARATTLRIFSYGLTERHSPVMVGMLDLLILLGNWG